MAMPHVYQGVKYDILPQDTQSLSGTILYDEQWTETHKETENVNNYLDSACYIQQIAAQFCAVPLQSPFSKIKTSQQIVQIMTGILVSPVLTLYILKRTSEVATAKGRREALGKLSVVTNPSY